LPQFAIEHHLLRPVLLTSRKRVPQSGAAHTPRATGSESIDKWIAAGRTGAVIAGAFAVSSNRFSFERNFGGAGWIIAPDGEILGLTNEREPFVTVDCALAIANHAKSTYPRSALNLAQ
jgi:predicted amidohydrolase